jgi:hypothetical protein
MKAIQNTYSGTSMASNPVIANILSTTDSALLTQLGSSMVKNSLGGSVVSTSNNNSQTFVPYVCDTPDITLSN